MSLTKSAATRLSLLASTSSLVAIGACAVMATFTAPTTARAQATCAPPPASGNGTNTVTYAGGPGVTYDPGITCVYTGQTATVSTTGAIVVSAAAGGNGVNLSSTGSDDIAWDSTAGTVTGGAGTNGPVIEALTVNGDIRISTDRVLAANGIRAVSSGSGDVNVTLPAGLIDAEEGLDGIGIDASSGSGDVAIDATGAFLVRGRLYGIRAASGTSPLTIDATEVQGIDVGISATTGTGLLTINSTFVIGYFESALRINTGGDANINLVAAYSNNVAVDLATTSGTQTTLDIGLIQQASSSGGLDSIALRASGGGNITLNTGEVRGLVDFSASTGNIVWNVEERWVTGGLANNFGPGDTTVVIGEGADMLVTLRGSGGAVGNTNALETFSIDFGAGDDVLTNNGIFMVGPKSVSGLVERYDAQGQMESEVRLIGLDTFDNAGSIYFGGSAFPGAEVPAGAPADLVETDYTPDDILVLPGTHFVGSEGSRLIIDAFLTENQSACDPGLRDTALTDAGTLSGEMPASDCMSIPGGSTEGVTSVLINQLATGDRGGSVRIVLVDVTGGTSEGGHFVLDPLNLGYNPDQGGYLDLGYLIMPLVYDADTQQHVLLGTAGQNAWQTAGWAAAAHEVWRTSTGSWFDRQADLRGGLEAGVGGGIWLRTSADFTDREVAHVQTAGTSAFTFDNSYEQRTYAVTGGADLLVGGGADSAWAVGLMAGYANSELTYDASPNTAQFDSWNGGVYASFLSGGLYIDAALTGNRADIKADMPEVGLAPVGTLLDTTLITTGAQIEAGWRFPVMEGAFIEPLAGVSYVRSKWEDLPIASDDPLRPGIDVEFDDPTSLRANIGARLGMDQDYGSWRSQYSILGRVWNEFEGEHILALHNTQEDIMVGDEFTGQFTEFGVGVSLYGLGEALSGFANFGGKFGDDYQSQNLSAGVRVNW